MQSGVRAVPSLLRRIDLGPAGTKLQDDHAPADTRSADIRSANAAKLAQIALDVSKTGRSQVPGPDAWMLSPSGVTATVTGMSCTANS